MSTLYNSSTCVSVTGRVQDGAGEPVRTLGKGRHSAGKEASAPNSLSEARDVAGCQPLEALGGWCSCVW